MAFFTSNLRLYNRGYLVSDEPVEVPPSQRKNEMRMYGKGSLVFDKRKRIHGKVTRIGLPVGRKVFALSVDGYEIHETTSDPVTGEYEFLGLRNNMQYNLIAMAEDEGYVSKAQGPITPVDATLVADNPVLPVDFDFGTYPVDAYWDNVVSYLDFNVFGTIYGVNDLITTNGWTTHGETVISEDEFAYNSASLFVGTDITGIDNGITLNDNTLDGFDLDGDFTIEFWLNHSGSANLKQTILWKSQAYDIRLDYTSPNSFIKGTFYNDVAGSVTLPSTNTAITANVWTHIAFTRSGDTYYCFVNGSLIQSTTLSGAGAANDNNVLIGASEIAGAGTLTNCLVGYIDYFRMTKGVARYTSAFSPPSEPYPTGELNNG